MKKIKRIMALTVIAATMLVASACGAKTAAPTSVPTTAPTAAPTAAPTSAPAAGGWTIAIEGTDKGSVTFNEAEAAKVGLVKQSASVKDKDTSLPAQEYGGVSLEKVLAYYGVKSYTTVKVESSDGTYKEYTPDLVSSSKALLGFKADGKALDSETGPVQLVVDGKGPNWWIRKVTKITVIK